MDNIVEEKTKKVHKPTDEEKMNIIGQPDEERFKRLNLNRSDIDFLVGDYSISLYASDDLADYYISINDYCGALPTKSDGGKFMYDLKYPDIVLAYSSGEGGNNVRSFFLNVHGVESMKSCIPYSKKFQDKKDEIFNAFFACLKSNQNQSFVEQKVENTSEEQVKPVQDFKMFDDTPDFSEEKKSDDNVFGDIIMQIASIKDTMDQLCLENEQLREENESLKEAVKKKTCYVPDEEKMNALKKFYTLCQNASEPFTDSDILDVLTKIIDKAAQMHIQNGVVNHSFIKDFNKAKGYTTIYKDQRMERPDEPFVRIAMRLYGYEVLDYGLNSHYRDSILYQFKNMFGINITNNTFILSDIISLLQRKFKFSVGPNNQLIPDIDFVYKEVSGIKEA